MSRKTIPFPVQQKAAPVAPSFLPPTAASPGEMNVDRWVAEPGRPGEKAPSPPLARKDAERADALTITISDAPDLFELWRIGVFLPYALAWRWALGAAKRARGFAS